LSNKKFKFSGFVGKTKKNKKAKWEDKDIKKIFKKVKYAVIGIGQIKSSSLRISIFKKLKKIGFKFPVLISPNSYVSKSAVIREGTVVMHGAIINAKTLIGKNCIINSKALIEHDVVIGDNSFLGSSATVVNNIKISKSKFIKAGTLVKKNLK
jgi:UDP-3-O-[3-hydroxymyristoyl] glucosamine N-acyltransferase